MSIGVNLSIQSRSTRPFESETSGSLLHLYLRASSSKRFPTKTLCYCRFHIHTIASKKARNILACFLRPPPSAFWIQRSTSSLAAFIRSECWKRIVVSSYRFWHSLFFLRGALHQTSQMNCLHWSPPVISRREEFRPRWRWLLAERSVWQATRTFQSSFKEMKRKKRNFKFLNVLSTIKLLSSGWEKAWLSTECRSHSQEHLWLRWQRLIDAVSKEGCTKRLVPFNSGVGWVSRLQPNEHSSTRCRLETIGWKSLKK